MEHCKKMKLNEPSFRNNKFAVFWLKYCFLNEQNVRLAKTLINILFNNIFLK
jgi:hypothetical protein